MARCGFVFLIFDALNYRCIVKPMITLIREAVKRIGQVHRRLQILLAHVAAVYFAFIVKNPGKYDDSMTRQSEILHNVTNKESTLAECAESYS